MLHYPGQQDSGLGSAPADAGILDSWWQGKYEAPLVHWPWTFLHCPLQISLQPDQAGDGWRAPGAGLLTLDSGVGICYCIDLPSLFYVSQTQNNRWVEVLGSPLSFHCPFSIVVTKQALDIEYELDRHPGVTCVVKKIDYLLTSQHNGTIYIIEL